MERLGKEIKECEKRMMEIINADGKIKRNYDHITSIGGVGLINATALIVFTGNFNSRKNDFLWSEDDNEE